MIKLRRAGGLANARIVSLVNFLCRDGTLHFLLLLVLNVLQMVLWVTNTFTVTSVIISPISSIIISRFLLNIRRYHLSANTNPTDDSTCSLGGEGSVQPGITCTEYLSTFIGSMGASLNEGLWSTTGLDSAEDDIVASDAGRSSGGAVIIELTERHVKDSHYRR